MRHKSQPVVIGARFKNSRRCNDAIHHMHRGQFLPTKTNDHRSNLWSGYRLVPFTAYEVSCRVRTERCSLRFRFGKPNSPRVWFLRSLIPLRDSADKNYLVVATNYCRTKYISRFQMLVKQKEILLPLT